MNRLVTVVVIVWVLQLIFLSLHSGHEVEESECVTSGATFDGKLLYIARCRPKICTPKDPVDGFQCKIGNFSDHFPGACEKVEKALEEKEDRGPPPSEEDVCLPILTSISLYDYRCPELKHSPEKALRVSFLLPLCNMEFIKNSKGVKADFKGHIEAQKNFFTQYGICRTFNYSESDFSGWTNSSITIELEEKCMAIGLQDGSVKTVYYFALTEFPSGVQTNYTIMFNDVANDSMQLLAGAWLSTGTAHFIFLPIAGISTYRMQLEGDAGHWTESKEVSKPSVKIENIPRGTNTVTVTVTPNKEECDRLGCRCSPITQTIIDKNQLPDLATAVHPSLLPGHVETMVDWNTYIVVGVGSLLAVGLLVAAVVVYRYCCKTDQGALQEESASVQKMPILWIDDQPTSSQTNGVEEWLCKKGFEVTHGMGSEAPPVDLMRGHFIIIVVLPCCLSDRYKEFICFLLENKPLWNRVRVISCPNEDRVHPRPSDILRQLFTGHNYNFHKELLGYLDGRVYKIPEDQKTLLENLMKEEITDTTDTESEYSDSGGTMSLISEPVSVRCEVGPGSRGRAHFTPFRTVPEQDAFDAQDPESQFSSVAGAAFSGTEYQALIHQEHQPLVQSSRSTLPERLGPYGASREQVGTTSAQDVPPIGSYGASREQVGTTSAQDVLPIGSYGASREQVGTTSAQDVLPIGSYGASRELVGTTSAQDVLPIGPYRACRELVGTTSAHNVPLDASGHQMNASTSQNGQREVVGQSVEDPNPEHSSVSSAGWESCQQTCRKEVERASPEVSADSSELGFPPLEATQDIHETNRKWVIEGSQNPCMPPAQESTEMPLFAAGTNLTQDLDQHEPEPGQENGERNALLDTSHTQVQDQGQSKGYGKGSAENQLDKAEDDTHTGLGYENASAGNQLDKVRDYAHTGFTPRGPPTLPQLELDNITDVVGEGSVSRSSAGNQHTECAKPVHNPEGFGQFARQLERERHSRRLIGRGPETGGEIELNVNPHYDGEREEGGGRRFMPDFDNSWPSSLSSVSAVTDGAPSSSPSQSPYPSVSVSMSEPQPTHHALAAPSEVYPRFPRAVDPPVLPGGNGVLPGGNRMLPGGNVAGGNDMLPGANGVLPGANGVLPGANGVLPGANGVLPGANGMLPGGNGVLPGGNRMLPVGNVAGGNVLPGGIGVLPGGNGVLPDANGMLPRGNGVLPGGNGVLPGANGVLPGGNGMLPGGNVAGGNVLPGGRHVAGGGQQPVEQFWPPRPYGGTDSGCFSMGD